MDKKAGIGELSCKVCGQQFQTGINCRLPANREPFWISATPQRSDLITTDLSAGVDVYSDWIDACDSVAKEAAETSPDATGQDSHPYSALSDDRRGSDTYIAQHMTTAVETNEDGMGDFDDDVV